MSASVITRCFAVVWASLILLAGSGLAPASAAGAKPAPQFQSQADILRYITHYRDEPTPQHLPYLVRAMAGLGLLEDTERAGVHIGFVAGVLADNQVDAERLVREMFPLPPASQVAVIKGARLFGAAGMEIPAGQVRGAYASPPDTHFRVAVRQGEDAR